MHDFVLFIGYTGLRPDEAGQLQHRDARNPGRYLTVRNRRGATVNRLAARQRD